MLVGTVFKTVPTKNRTVYKTLLRNWPNSSSRILNPIGSRFDFSGQFRQHSTAIAAAGEKECGIEKRVLPPL